MFTQSVMTCGGGSGTGISMLTQNSGISVYPNPNSGTFNVSINTIGDLVIEVYNMIGSLVYKGKLVNGDNKINLNVSSGVFFYKIIKNDTKIYEGKLVVE